MLKRLLQGCVLAAISVHAFGQIQGKPIDRHALVTRHNPTITAVDKLRELWNGGVEKRRDAAGVSPADFNYVKKVTSVGVFDPGPATDPPPAGARPVFASAGPDGNFRTHEDNVYSFDE